MEKRNPNELSGQFNNLRKKFVKLISKRTRFSFDYVSNIKLDITLETCHNYKGYRPKVDFFIDEVSVAGLPKGAANIFEINIKYKAWLVIAKKIKATKEYKGFEADIDNYWAELKGFHKELNKCIYGKSKINLITVQSKIAYNSSFSTLTDAVNSRNRDYLSQKSNGAMVGKQATVQIGGKTYIARIEKENG